MIRQVNILCVIILCSNAIAQDWQLFPPNQLSHYQVGTENPDIRSFEIDSIQVTGESTVHLFRRYMGPLTSCYWQNREMLSYLDDDDFIIDSLVYSNDFVVYYFKEADHVFEFVFKHTAKPGEEWSLSSHLSRKGTCISSGVGNIRGVTDSIKFYTLQTVLGDVDFILSKTHGLLQFIPFTDFFLEIPLKNSTVFPYYYFIGYSSDTETYGFQFPGFGEYFHLSAGDLLLWKYNFYDMMDYTTHYYRDSILTSTIYPDSVIYGIFRVTYDVNAQPIGFGNISVSYYKDEYNYLLLSPAKWFTTRENEYYNVIYFIDDANFYFSDNDTVIVKEFSEDGCSFIDQEGECYIVCLDNSDYDTKYKVSTLEGLTYFSEPYGRELKLLGSFIDGVERGSMQIPLGVEHMSDSPFRVYPNPTSGSVHITNKTDIYKIELYNTLGVLLYSGEGSGKIDISDYPEGYYHLIIYTYMGRVYTHEVIHIN